MDDQNTPAGLGRWANRFIDLMVASKVVGTRLDQFLAAQFPDYSRSVWQKAIEAGKVTVNETSAKPSYKIRAGDRIRFELPEPTHDLPVPEDIPLDILYEDEYLAVINKPFAMVVHPAKGHWSGTLVNALAFRFGQLPQSEESGAQSAEREAPEKGGPSTNALSAPRSALSCFRTPGDHRPGIVHRLDRDTSGVILIAKEEFTHRALSAQFERRKVFKEYLAITAGVLDRDSDYIEKRIGHHPNDRVKMAVYDSAQEEGKEACSFYEVLERFQGYSFCRIQPRTGRTHQIRVHLASIGCPVLADKMYSGRACLRLSDLVADLDPTKDEVLMGRQALHASRLRFQHPRLGQVIAVEAPLPPEFEKTLAALRKYCTRRRLV